MSWPAASRVDDVAVLLIRMNISKLVRSEHRNTTVTLTVLIVIKTMANANAMQGVRDSCCVYVCMM